MRRGENCSNNKTLDLCGVSQYMVDLMDKLSYCVNKYDGNRQTERWTDAGDDNNSLADEAEF